jgi:peptidoglycan/LPS O-acetylase OafA/YrhL
LASVAPHIGAVLLLIGVIGSSRIQAALETKPCLSAGRVSYSLYLSHLVLLLTLVSLFHQFVPVYVILLALPPLALALAGVLYWLLEQPAMSLGRRLERRVDANSGFRSQDKVTATSAGLAQ